MKFPFRSIGWMTVRYRYLGNRFSRVDWARLFSVLADNVRAVWFPVLLVLKHPAGSDCEMNEDGSDTRIYTENKKHTKFDEEKEKCWNGPFYFIQGADIQFGFIDSYLEKKEKRGWELEKELAKKCVEKINNLSPKPKFFVICGDLCDATPLEDPETRKEQQKDFYKIFNLVDPEIPLVCVCGNHDVGDHPTVEAVNMYRSSFGDDYFSFWCGGVLFLVINSQYYFDGSKVKDIFEDQSRWLEGQLELSKDSRHGAVIFQHIPWFLDDYNSTTAGYFAIEKDVRIPMLDKFINAGVRYIFCGHYHRNSGGFYKGLENVVTSAIGGQLGNDESGFRIVRVLGDKVCHQYYGLDEVPEKIVL